MKKCNKRNIAELAAASTMEDEDDDNTLRMREKKKRRISPSDYEFSTSSSLRTLLLPKTTENDQNSSSQTSALNSLHASFSSSSSPCSSNDSNSNHLVIHSLGSVDLKSEDKEIPQSKSRERERETTPLSDLCIPDEMNSTADKSYHHIVPSAAEAAEAAKAKMPSTAEIEDFFAGAEKLEQKRFIDKYNYDIVKDVPLQGRFQWIRLKP